MDEILEIDVGSDAPALQIVGSEINDLLRRARTLERQRRLSEYRLASGLECLELAAGVDWVPTRDLPRELLIAANKGGGAEPMSEHVVALALAAAKRLFIEHANLKRGEFNQRSANRMLRGGVCGILGFGNVGVATARLMRAFGMNRFTQSTDAARATSGPTGSQRPPGRGSSLALARSQCQPAAVMANSRST